MNSPYTSDAPEDDGVKLLDILHTMAGNARLLVFGPILVGLAFVGLAYLLPPKYVAQTTILPPQQQNQGMAAAAMAQVSAMMGLPGMGGGGGNQAAMYVGFLKSRTIADRMIDRFGLMKIRGIKTRDDARKALARHSRFTVGKEGLITIAVMATSPKVAAATANAYVQELVTLSDRLAITEAQARRVFLESELAKAKENLVKSETALGDAGLTENVLKFNPTVLGQGLATLKAQIMAKELQLASMRGYLAETNIDYRLARDELAALRAQMAKYENVQPSGANAEFIQRFRDFKYHEVLYEQLAKQLELAKLDELREGPLVQVVDVAVPPDRKENLHKAIFGLLGWFVAGVVLLGYVFVRNSMKNAAQDAESAGKLAAIRAGFARVLKPWQRRRPVVS